MNFIPHIFVGARIKNPTRVTVGFCLPSENQMLFTLKNVVNLAENNLTTLHFAATPHPNRRSTRNSQTKG
jgi:hypothetical protein